MQARNCLYFALVLLAVSPGCAGKAVKAEANPDAAAEEENALAVQAAPLELRTIAETVSGLGRCEALPDRIASITPAVEGQVQKLLVKLGDSVQKGQPLVQLDSRIAEANLAEKAATRDGLIATLALLKAPPRPEELKNQQSIIDQAKLTYEKAQATAERLRPLLEKQQIPPSQVYEADLAVSLAKLQFEAAEAQLQVMKLGPRAEAIAEAEAHITTADALVDSARAQLSLYALKSPIAGEVNSLNCRLGQTLSLGSAIGEVVEVGKTAVVVWLPTRDASRVAVGQKARINLASAANPKPAADADEDEEPVDDSVAASVTFVGHIADPQTGNLPVQILVDNTEGRFAVGQVVSAEITVNEKSDVLAAPIAALFDVGDGTVIDIIRDGKSVRVQPEIGIRDKHWVEIAGVDIKDPPKPGEMAVVEGGYNLPEGTPVKIKEKADEEAKPADEKAVEGAAAKDEKAAPAESKAKPKETATPAPDGGGP